MAENQITSNKPRELRNNHKLIFVIGAVLVFAVSYWIASTNYLLFHSLADMATVFIAASVFFIVWNGRRFLDNHYFLFVSIAFLFFAFWDFIHLLGNKNMGVFPQYGNLGPTLYIISRYFLGISLLIAPVFIKRKLNPAVLFSIYSAATILLLLSVFYWNNFPVTYIEGVGLTSFKVISDYVVCAILAGATGFLLVNRKVFDEKLLRKIIYALILAIGTGLAFTLYTDPFGILNMIGHFFQITSFYLVYIAFVETALTKPQDILFRNLKKSEEETGELNARLEKANLDLKQDISQRKLVEEALKQSEERFFKAFKASPMALAITKTGDGTFIDINDSYERLMGFTREELIGRKTTEFNIYIYPEQRAEIIRELTEKGSVRDKELTFRRKDGHLVDTLCSLEVISVGSEKLFLSSLIDITERKRAEEKLKESDLHFRLAMRNAPVSVAVQNLDLK